MSNSEFNWITADVKTCIHNHVFLSNCKECKYEKLLEFVKYATKAYDDDRGYALLKEIGEADV